MPGTEHDGEQDQHGAESQRQLLWGDLPGQYAERGGDGPDLQGDIGQRADQHEQGHQGTCQLAAVAEGEHVGKGGELVVPGQAQQRFQQQRGE